MIKFQGKKKTIVCVSMLFVASSFSQALAVSPFMKQGIADYHNGDFNTAAGNLGAALSQDFNNPTLHYYLANCYVHMKQMPSAVKEFRIAFAIDPEGPVGKFSKQALDFLDVDLRGGELKKKSAPNPEPKLDPAMEKALSILDKQSSKESTQHSLYGKNAASDYQRHSENLLQKSRNDAVSQLPWWMQPKKDNELPPELSKYLDGLRKQYESNQSGYRESGNRQASEMQRSADNLKGLLQEKPKDGKTHLDPLGTNLYTRNYKSGTQDESKKPGAIPAKDDALFHWK